MRVVVIGLGIQGTKRLAVAGEDVVGTVDPVEPKAQYKAIEEVPLGAFDAACVCTPDRAKLDLVAYLLARGKHVLVEKPLVAPDGEQIRRLEEMARSAGVSCYTAYNHRFEPHLARMKELLDTRVLGNPYFARLFYGNGTAVDVKRSPWRDEGLGVLADLGSHLLDLVLFFFGPLRGRFEPWSLNHFENRAFDHVLFGFNGQPAIEIEATLLSWRNTFAADIYGESGSVHVHGLCKWGPSTFIHRRRKLPSGPPDEETVTIARPDPTWRLEYKHFKQLCRQGDRNLDNDIWINQQLNQLIPAVQLTVKGSANPYAGCS